MGVGPSTPTVRCLSTAEAVQGLSRLVLTSDTELSATDQQNCHPSFHSNTVHLPVMNSVNKVGSTTSSTAGLRTTKTAANGSPAKRPTAFVNLPRTSTLNVRYDGLTANKTMEARRIEMQGQGALRGNSHSSQLPKEGHGSNNLHPPPKPQTCPQPTNTNSSIAIRVPNKEEVESKEKNLISGTDTSKEESKSNEVQQTDAVEASKKQAESAEPGKDEPSVGKKTKKFKLTPEETAEKFESGLKKIKGSCDIMSMVAPRDLEQEGQPYTHEFRQCALVFANSYLYFKKGEAPLSEILRYRSCVAEILCQDYVLNAFLNTLADGLKRREFFSDTGEVVRDYFFPIKNIFNTLFNFSDSVETIKFSITEHQELIPECIKILENCKEPHMNKALTAEQEKILRWILGIIHNCGSLEENVPRLRSFNIIPILLTYTDSPVAVIRLSSITALADLVNESEAELLSLHSGIFTFILNKVERAFKMENHRDLGWSAEELLRAVRQLARNDANKGILVEKGCLPVLLNSLRLGTDEELQEAMDCLWILSFDDSNKSKIVDEPGLVQAVSDKYHTASGRILHSCHGILWSLREILQQREEFMPIASEILNLKSQATPKVESKAVVEDVSEMSAGLQFQGHVMISYQWANQEAIKRICAELRSHGIPVWIDIDYMGGSTLQAMAQAVEDSFAVIIAMSQKYKDSPNTRAEAEYTFQQRKPIIPLIMQNGYRPDGWLGLILGSKLFYDFSGKYSFDSRMDGLLKATLAVARKGDGDAVDGVEQPLVATKAGAASLTSPSVLSPPAPIGRAQVMPRPTAAALNEEKIRSWSKEDVSKWLSKFKLEESAMKELSGEEIVFMHNLKYEAPEFFYSCLDKKLNVTSILDLANASRAFQDLSSQA